MNVFVVKKGSLLLGKRKNIYGHGQWGLPGGHLEFKEKMEPAARRELFEETGLRAKKLIFLNIANDAKEQKQQHYIHIGFLAKNVRGKLFLKEPDKCSEWKWFPLGNLPKNIFIGHRKQIKGFLRKAVFIEG